MTSITTEAEYRLKVAEHAARRSTLKRHKTGAAIFSKNGLIQTGWSHVSHINLKQTPRSMHAELHAIIRSAKYGRVPLKDTTIYVVTLTPGGNRTVSAPCPCCQIILNELEMEAVY